MEWDAGRHAGIKQQLTWRVADQQGLLVRKLCIELAWQDSWSKQQRGAAPQLKAGAVCWTCFLQWGARISILRGSRWCISIPIAVVNKIKLILSWGSWLSL